ncbi:JUN factor, partial [Piaya cayana]|nr:JUN factor [Piaya cayana]
RGRRMETPFYHDDVLSGLGSGFAPSSSGSSGLLLPFPGGSMMKKDALGMALPEQVAAALKGPGGASSGEAAGLLGSAELGLLKLASPELERLIIQSNGLVTTTPTSGQFLYPKAAASEEQEFAEGFVKALEDLHKQNQLGAAAGGAGGGGGGGGKDEPQIVPEVPSFGESPPLSPIDMDTQERIKAERKRLRNRIAASKCRKRKLERISRLEEKVKSLKSQNTELASTASLLREQVAQLKQKVLSHVNSGCQLLPQHQHQVP